jgi:hypothetical protein
VRHATSSRRRAAVGAGALVEHERARGSSRPLLCAPAPDGRRAAGTTTARHAAARRTAQSCGLLALGDPGLELLHDRGVAQGGDVAELAALGDVAQQAAHDLARAGLGQVVGPDDALRAGQLADALGDVLAQLVDHRVVADVVALERHERRDALARVLVGLPDDGRLGHGVVGDDRALHLRGGQAVARDVDDVVDAGR